MEPRLFFGGRYFPVSHVLIPPGSLSPKLGPTGGDVGEDSGSTKISKTPQSAKLPRETEEDGAEEARLFILVGK